MPQISATSLSQTEFPPRPNPTPPRLNFQHKLRELYLIYTKITDAVLKDLAKLQKLVTLYLGVTDITDACLNEMAKLQNLEWLGLEATQVTKAGVAELRKALPNCRISGP